MTCIELKLPVVETLLAVFCDALVCRKAAGGRFYVYQSMQEKLPVAGSLYYELVRKQIHSSLYLFRVCNGRSSVTILLSITAEVGMTATVNYILAITFRQIFK